MFKLILFVVLFISYFLTFVAAQELKDSTKDLETSSIKTNNSTEEVNSTENLINKKC